MGQTRGRRATVAVSTGSAGFPGMIRRTATDGGFTGRGTSSSITSAQIAAIPEEPSDPYGGGGEPIPTAAAGESMKLSEHSVKSKEAEVSGEDTRSGASVRVESIPDHPMKEKRSGAKTRSSPRSSTPPTTRSTGVALAVASTIDSIHAREQRGPAVRGTISGTDWFRSGVTFVQYSAIAECLQRYGA